MKTKQQKLFDAVSLFSGCGGSDLGLRQAGVQTVWANDASESACELYDAVTGTKSIIQHGDVSKISKFPKTELLVGCYPCQGYSQGGRRNEKDPINYLYQQFDRALRKVRPRAFIVENVDGMRFSQNEHLLRAQLTRFRFAGYTVVWQVLDAKDYGLAQDRKRLFIVGIRTSERKQFAFPIPTHGPSRENPYLTIKDRIWHLRNPPAGSYNEEQLHWYYLSRNRRREWNQQSTCIVAHWRHVGLHPDSPPLKKLGTDRWTFAENGFARRFSYLECAALQGFLSPSSFCVRSVEERFRAIGNAVPPPLFAAVARALVAQLQGKHTSLPFCGSRFPPATT
ncbi:MAG TPA: DNA (cytosine-5-)-methyltransferase [Verrucomicrobiae bacterium]|nr:DNA (cytosine-5-)-methyltransferase [Verrucomicrobiae bacterium]